MMFPTAMVSFDENPERYYLELDNWQDDPDKKMYVKLDDRDTKYSYNELVEREFLDERRTSIRFFCSGEKSGRIYEIPLENGRYYSIYETEDSVRGKVVKSSFLEGPDSDVDHACPLCKSNLEFTPVRDYANKLKKRIEDDNN